jgi:hypothetical protein
MNMTALYNSRRSKKRNDQVLQSSFRARCEPEGEAVLQIHLKGISPAAASAPGRAFHLGRSAVLVFFSHRFRPLAIANQLRHEIRLWTRVP